MNMHVVPAPPGAKLMTPLQENGNRAPRGLSLAGFEGRSRHRENKERLKCEPTIKALYQSSYLYLPKGRRQARSQGWGSERSDDPPVGAKRSLIR